MRAREHYSPPEAPLVEGAPRPELRRYQRARIALLVLLGSAVANNALFVFGVDPSYPAAIALVVLFLVALPGGAFYLILRRRHAGYVLAGVLCTMSFHNVTTMIARDPVTGGAMLAWMLAVLGLAVYAARGFFGRILPSWDPNQQLPHP
jgi:hypothetical protein